MKMHHKFVPHGIIILVLMMMIKTHLPMDKTLFKSIYYPVDQIQRFFGFNQSWMMFSPNPSRLDAYVMGEVEFIDGSKWTFDFLDKNSNSIIQKYLKGEKYRKFASENLRQDSNNFLWEDASNFVLKKVLKDSSEKRPIKVTLTRYWSETPDWNKTFLKHSKMKEKYQSYTFYSREVD